MEVITFLILKLQNEVNSRQQEDVQEGGKKGLTKEEEREQLRADRNREEQLAEVHGEESNMLTMLKSDIDRLSIEK